MSSAGDVEPFAFITGLPRHDLAHASAVSQSNLLRTSRHDVWANYLLEKNPATVTKIKVDVEEKGLKISN
jgi:hypothetical protein